ncbi:conserved domain protein [Bacteroides fluxus YIT 12057]|uniref:Conserved domain protein n=1 Tax=Bacteroides fluxus YIT 12057 TaxID=763034 RepID=F3PW91_9BACE|nr:conserved domain protein [Bacteroides fluxus YIT 12057]
MQKMPLHKLKIIIIYSYFIAVSPKAVLAILGSISTAQLCKQRKAKIEIMSIYIVLFILF